MSDLVVIGKVSSARGLKGQFKIISYTKNAEDIFNYGPITIGDKYIDVQLSKVSTTKNLLVASVYEIDTREKAVDIINNNKAEAHSPKRLKKSFIDSIRAVSNLKIAISSLCGSLQIMAPAAPININNPIN